MRRPTRTRAAFALLVTVVAGCTTLAPATPHPEKSRYTMAPPTPTMTAIATVAPTGHGRPYTPEGIAAMFKDTIASQPAAIAGALQTPSVIAAIANVVADDVYSYDGQAYQKVFLVGRCTKPPDSCEFQLRGHPAFVSDPEAEDTYIWTVTPRTPLVVLTSAGLGGFPPDLTDSLDALARSLDAGNKIGDRFLISVGWMLPPLQDAYVLTYSHQGMEGDPPVSVTLDRAERRILSIRTRP